MSGNSLRPPRALPCFSRPLNAKRCLPEAPASNDVYLTHHQAWITCQNLPGRFSLRGQRSYVELLHGGGRAWGRGYQNLRIPLTNFSLDEGFTSRHMNSLSSCDRFSMGLQPGDSARVFHQLTPSSVKKALYHPGGVLGVIVLHQAMTIWVNPANEW